MSPQEKIFLELEDLIAKKDRLAKWMNENPEKADGLDFAQINIMSAYVQIRKLKKARK